MSWLDSHCAGRNLSHILLYVTVIATGNVGFSTCHYQHLGL